MFKVNVEGIEPYIVEELIRNVNANGWNAEFIEKKDEIQAEIPNFLEKLKFKWKVMKMKR